MRSRGTPLPHLGVHLQAAEDLAGKLRCGKYLKSVNHFFGKRASCWKWTQSVDPQNWRKILNTYNSGKRRTLHFVPPLGNDFQKHELSMYCDFKIHIIREARNTIFAKLMFDRFEYISVQKKNCKFMHAFLHHDYL